MEKDVFINKLRTLSLKTVLPLSSVQCEAFYTYHQLLLAYNKVMDLTAIIDENEMILRHYLDSLSLFSFSYAFKKDSLRIIDVGTGAGLPGIPLAIVLPKSNIFLLDAQQKRIDFLRTVVDALNLNHVTLIHGRAEDIARDPNYREFFDIATARAVAPLPVLLEYLLPFIKVSGFSLCLKGPKAQEEMENSLSAAQTLGGQFLPSPSIILPQEDYSPILIVCEKTDPTAEKYPRKAGIPTKRPL